MFDGRSALSDVFVQPLADLLDDVAGYGRKFLVGLPELFSTTDFTSFNKRNEEFRTGSCTSRRSLQRLSLSGWRTGFEAALELGV